MADNTTPAQPEDENKSPHAGGRPLKYDTVEKLELAIQLYFDTCDPHTEKRMVATGVNPNGETMFQERSVITEQRPYTMAGLARAIGLDRRSLLNYKNRDQYFPSIQGAIDRCEEYAEGQLFGPYANGAKFNLINNYRENPKSTDWSDRHEVTGADGVSLMPMGLDSAILARNQERGETPPVTADDSGE